MKNSIIITVITALILMFVSLISWIINQQTFAIIASNLGLLILAVVVLWTNRSDLPKI
ncbi:hypothetical protein [Weissella muntiaci]|uniref:hypothetical protein n=1 Tax=Weissella muntiaci TaxID=2508881 RepID=UPI001651EFAA|nr:hypothetical protein [Weissella muntiaci]